MANRCESKRWSPRSERRQATKSFRWRLSLHTIFVSNLPYRISRKVIWEVFNKFGVVDVFIPYRRREGFSNFAFVRYRFADESFKAVKFGNGRRLDGKSISVRKATDKKLDRASHGREVRRSAGGQFTTNSDSFPFAPGFHQRNVRDHMVHHENRRVFPKKRDQGLARGKSHVCRDYNRDVRQGSYYLQNSDREKGKTIDGSLNGVKSGERIISNSDEPLINGPSLAPSLDVAKAETSKSIEKEIEEGEVTVEKNEEAVTVVSKGVDVSPAPFFYAVQEDPLLSINELALVSEGGIDDAFTDDLLHAKDGFGSDEINDE
ncbi:hypothetical protein COLO4_26538 [Corchorus olitorius]|uniref:RRM domain-containing protein n=1 Tax=Corchorus olitorius TaxID=93759 RepID=A0A1R3HWK7_9ROSI|nr:hypothetical protein COLO4_26538 [Corchorus olitorius]